MTEEGEYAGLSDDEFDQLVIDLMVEDIKQFGPEWFAHMVYEKAYEPMREEYNNKALQRYKQQQEA